MKVAPPLPGPICHLGPGSRAGIGSWRGCNDINATLMLWERHQSGIHVVGDRAPGRGKRSREHRRPHGLSADAPL